jgi:putative transposase
VFNRSVGSQPIFISQPNLKRALEVASFYSYSDPPLRFSHYNCLENKEKFLFELKLNCPKLIDLFSFCLMPNHFHFLIKQSEDSGIQKFMRNFQNSYAKYFNIKTKRHGALFQSQFKAVRIETDEQLLHVCRYIHLNPFSSFVINSIEELENYAWSSLPDYLGKRKLELINKQFILNYFSSLDKFKSFTYDRADYQKKLKELEYFTLEGESD